MLRKPRPDSVIGSQLPPIIKDDVDTMLLSGESYRKVQQRLEEDGIKLSQEAIRRYYHSQILPARLARQNKTAEELNKISVEGVDEASMRAIRSAALDRPPPRPATLRPLTSWWDSSSRPSSWPKTSAASRYWRPRLPRPTPPNRSPSPPSLQRSATASCAISLDANASG